MFPIHDAFGGFLAFQGRAIDAHAEKKYLHSPFEKSDHLFGLCEQWEQCLQAPFIILTEGPIDVLSLYQCNLIALGTLGSSFSFTQACLVRRYNKEALLWFDADDAGQKVQANSIKLLKEVGVKVSYMPRYRPFKDPNAMLMKMGYEGVREALRERVYA